MELISLIFAVVVCGWVFSIFTSGQRFLMRAKHRHQSYALFNVRDRLYWLVVDRKLLSKSPAFRFIEDYLNLAVHSTRHLNVDQLIASLYEREIDQNKANKVVKWLSLEHEDVSQIYVYAFKTTREIIAENSPIVVWVCRNRYLRGFGRILLHYKIGKYFGLLMMQKAVRVIEKLYQMEKDIESQKRFQVT